MNFDRINTPLSLYLFLKENNITFALEFPQLEFFYDAKAKKISFFYDSLKGENTKSPKSDKILFKNNRFYFLQNDQRPLLVKDSSFIDENFFGVVKNFWISIYFIREFLKTKYFFRSSILKSFEETFEYLFQNFVSEGSIDLQNIVTVDEKKSFYIFSKNDFYGKLYLIACDVFSEFIFKQIQPKEIKIGYSGKKIYIPYERHYIYQLEIEKNVKELLEKQIKYMEEIRKKEIKNVRNYYDIRKDFILSCYFINRPLKRENELIKILKMYLELTKFYGLRKRDVPFLSSFVNLILFGLRNYTKKANDKIESYFNMMAYYGLMDKNFLSSFHSYIEKYFGKNDNKDSDYKEIVDKKLEKILNEFPNLEVSEHITHFFCLLFLRKMSFSKNYFYNLLGEDITVSQLLKLASIKDPFFSKFKGDLKLFKKYFLDFRKVLTQVISDIGISFLDIDLRESNAFYVDSKLNLILDEMDKSKRKEYYLIGISVKKGTNRAGAVFYVPDNNKKYTNKLSAADVVLALKLKQNDKKTIEGGIKSKNYSFSLDKNGLKNTISNEIRKYLASNSKLFSRQLGSRSLFLNLFTEKIELKQNNKLRVFVNKGLKRRIETNNHFIWKLNRNYASLLMLLIYNYFYYTTVGDSNYLENFSQKFAGYYPITLTYLEDKIEARNVIKSFSNFLKNKILLPKQKLKNYYEFANDPTNNITIIWVLSLVFDDSNNSSKEENKISDENKKYLYVLFKCNVGREKLKVLITEESPKPLKTETLAMLFLENKNVENEQLRDVYDNCLLKIDYYIFSNNKLIFKMRERQINLINRFLMHSDNILPLEEGGNALKYAGATRLDASLLEENFEIIKNNILSVLPVDEEDVIPLGSTFKKCTDYGDIDILLDTYGVHAETNLTGSELLDYIKGRLSTVFPQVQKVTDFCILTLLSPIKGNEFEYVQVDILPTSLFPKIENRERDIRYMLFAFASPVEGESKFKGAHRNILIQSLCENIEYNGNPIEFNPNIGLIVYDLEKPYAIRDVDKIIEILFGTGLSEEDLYSFEQVYMIIRKRYENKINDIMKTFFEKVSENKELLSYFQKDK